MLRKIVAALVLLLVVGSPAVAEAQKLVYVTRHAERADEPARNQEDPPLSKAGDARAAKLRQMLGDADIKAIYVTQFRRTQDTARPLASKLNIKPEVMPSSVTALVAALKSRHADDVVFIVAHSSTIPGIVKALAGHSVDVDESDYESLFVVVPATSTVSRIRY
jgi:broad specificity phosphatase PhoE